MDVAITWHYMRDVNTSSAQGSEAWAPTGHKVWDAWSDLTSMVQGEEPLGMGEAATHLKNVSRFWRVGRQARCSWARLGVVM